MPQIPNATRWNSYNACVKTFIDNYSKYLDIIIDHGDENPQNISRILQNVSIYKEATNLYRQLNDVSTVLDKLQADSTNIAESVELWLGLLDNAELLCHKDVIERRLKKALQPCHFLANLMDPRFSGKRLSVDQEEIAENWLIERNEDWHTFIMAFRIQDATYYPATMFSEAIKKKFTGAKWWLLMQSKGSKANLIPDDFFNFMISLSNCPASAAGIERVFSSYNLVWSDLRNRLGHEKAQKLVKVYKYLHSNSTEDV